MKAVKSLAYFYSILDYIFPVYFGLYFIQFYFGLWGVVSLVKFISILLVLFFFKEILLNCPRNTIFKVFSVYYMYVIFSGILYLVNGVSAKCYINELFNSIPAMFFVYAGMAEKRMTLHFYNVFLIYCTISMSIGLMLFFFPTEWFVARHLELIDNADVNAKYLLENMRFSSYIGDTYEVDMFAMIALGISLFTYYSCNKKALVLNLIFILVNFLAAIMTQQRVAMASATLALLFGICYGIKRRKTKRSLIIVNIIVILIISISSAVLLLTDRGEQIQLLINERIENMSVSQAIKDRSVQHDLIYKYWSMPITGHGAGAGGATAYNEGYHGVTDAGYYELLYENGIAGTLLFLIIIGSTLLRCTKHLRYYFTEFVVICFVLIAMLGSNTLTLGYMTIFPFWYCIGRVWNFNYYQHALINKLRI